MTDTPRPADPLAVACGGCGYNVINTHNGWRAHLQLHPAHLASTLDAARAPRSDVLRRAAVNAAPVVEALGEADRAPRSDVDVDETRDAQHDEEVDWAAPRSDDALDEFRLAQAMAAVRLFDSTSRAAPAAHKVAREYAALAAHDTPEEA